MSEPNFATIQPDFELAESHLEEFKDDTKAELDARALTLQHAINTAQEFKNLKEEEKNKDYGALFDGAFTALSIAFPALGIPAFLAKQAANAQAAYEIAKATATRVPAAALAVKGAIGAGKAAQKANDLKEKVGKMKEAVKASEIFVAKKTDDPAENLSGELDARWRAIKELIEANHKRLDAWKKAWGALFLKYQRRLLGFVGDDADDKKSLLDHAKEMVKLPPRFSPSELEELKSLYQWEMIAAWVRINVLVIETKVRGETEYQTRGLNGPQIDMLVKLFGPWVKRGKIFPHLPFMPNGYYISALLRMGPKVHKVDWSKVKVEPVIWPK